VLLRLVPPDDRARLTGAGVGVRHRRLRAAQDAARTAGAGPASDLGDLTADDADIGERQTVEAPEGVGVGTDLAVHARDDGVLQAAPTPDHRVQVVAARLPGGRPVDLPAEARLVGVEDQGADVTPEVEDEGFGPPVSAEQQSAHTHSRRDGTSVDHGDHGMASDLVSTARTSEDHERTRVRKDALTRGNARRGGEGRATTASVRVLSPVSRSGR